MKGSIMAEKIKKPPHRPSIYTPQLGKEICDTISNSNKSLQTLCMMNPHWPSFNAIYEWISDNREGFGEMYAKAKENQADFLVDDILRIIDKPETFIENGVEKNDVGMCRLKVDSLKWQAMKLKPRKYGDMRQIEELTADNVRVKAELEELRAKLNSENRKEY